MKKLSLLLCLCILLGLFTPLTALAQNQIMYVATQNHGTLKVRSSPSNYDETNVIGWLSYGTSVEVLEIQYGGTWALVYPANWSRTGYVMMEHLSYTNPQGGGGSSSVVDSNYVSDIFNGFTKVSGAYTVYARPDRASGWVNLRWAPSTKAAVQAQCYNGRSLRVLAENSYWYQVTDSTSGYTGFILKQYTTSGGYGSSNN